MLQCLVWPGFGPTSEILIRLVWRRPPSDLVRANHRKSCNEQKLIGQSRSFYISIWFKEMCIIPPINRQIYETLNEFERKRHLGQTDEHMKGWKYPLAPMAARVKISKLSQNCNTMLFYSVKKSKDDTCMYIWNDYFHDNCLCEYIWRKVHPAHIFEPALILNFWQCAILHLYSGLSIFRQCATLHPTVDPSATIWKFKGISCLKSMIYNTFPNFNMKFPDISLPFPPF